MKVTIVFEFNQVTDPNSPEADEIVEALTASTIEWGKDYNATVYVDNAEELNK